MVDNKSDVDSPTPFATGSTSAAEVSTAAAGSVGHSTSSHHHQHANANNDDQGVSGHRGEHAPSATEQASDREPAEGGEPDDESLAGTSASTGGDLYDDTGNAGFSPGTEGGLGDGAAGSAGGDPSAGANTIGNTSPEPDEARPPEDL